MKGDETLIDPDTKVDVNTGMVAEQCLKSVDRLGKGRTFPGDRVKVPSKTGVQRWSGRYDPCSL